MATIILDSTDATFIAANDGSKILGKSGYQSVKVNAGIQNVTLSSTVEEIVFTGNIDEYQFADAGGANLEILDLEGNVLSTMQAAINKSVTFANGTVMSEFDPNTGGIKLDGDELDETPATLQNPSFKDETPADGDTESPTSKSIELEVGTNAEPYEGTDAADVFELDVISARGIVDNTQHKITGFDTNADSMRFELADVAEGDYTLSDLNGTDGLIVQNNPFDGGSTLVTFGPDDDDDLISLELAGVTDASQVDVAVV